MTVDTKRSSSDILGRLILAAMGAYFLVKYNYEISQFLLQSAEILWDQRNLLLESLERRFDDAGILGALFWGVIALVYLLVTFILAFVVGGIVWVIAKMTELYVLPFIVTVLIVYSRFSYSFIARPLIKALGWLWAILRALVRGLGRITYTVVVLPISEIVSLKGSSGSRMHRVLMSSLFMIGSVCLLVGVIGVSITSIQRSGINKAADATIVGVIESGKQGITFTQTQNNVQVNASHPFWTETGIVVKKGDMISFTSTGRVQPKSPFRNNVSGPDGKRDILKGGAAITPRALTKSYRQRGYTPSNYIVDDGAIDGLIGKIGTGEPFFIGSSKELEIHEDGEILLGINQVWLTGAWSENKGSFTVNIVQKQR